MGRSTAESGFTRSYSMPTMPGNLVPFCTPVPANIQASGVATT